MLSAPAALSLAEIDAAAELIRDAVPPTPAYRWPLLCERLGVELVLKHENHTPLGAFKVRGGLTYVDALRRRAPHVTRLVCATRGNHGQSIAFAAARAGLRTTIVVPEGNSREKNAAMRALGAELVVYGRDFDEAKAHAATLVASDRHAEVVPSYHRDLVLGVATYARELFAAGTFDTVYVPIGLGSGISGVIAVRDLPGLATGGVGVVTERFPAYARSFAAGAVVETEPAETIADDLRREPEQVAHGDDAADPRPEPDRHVHRVERARREQLARVGRHAEHQIAMIRRDDLGVTVRRNERRRVRLRFVEITTVHDQLGAERAHRRVLLARVALRNDDRRAQSGACGCERDALAVVAARRADQPRHVRRAAAQRVDVRQPAAHFEGAERRVVLVLE